MVLATRILLWTVRRREHDGRSNSLLKQVPDNIPFTDDDIPQLTFRQA